MEHERGVALILALLVLSFLAILGGALLTTSTIDIWISDNYKTSTQNLYIAEAGIDYGRELLRTSNLTPSQLLAAAAGPDQQLMDVTNGDNFVDERIDGRTAAVDDALSADLDHRRVRQDPEVPRRVRR